MKFEELIGYKLVSIDDKKIIVKKDEKEYSIEFETDNGDCCGYNELETELLIEKNSNDNPVITNIRMIDKSDSDGDSVEIIFYGKNKELAKINSLSSSGSGWQYGACVSVKCNELNIEENITSW